MIAKRAGVVLRQTFEKEGPSLKRREGGYAHAKQFRRIHTQRPKDKHKLYALHAPEVECIGKGKAHQAYEFGVKVSIATTEKVNLIVGARAFPGNPYDGHTPTGH